MLKLVNIVKEYPTGDSKVIALKGIDIEFRKNEFVSILGPSGCGKTTTGRLLVKSEAPTSGRIFLNGNDVSSLQGRNLQKFRQQVQMIFQDPYESLNPRMTIFDIVAEPLTVHRIGSISDREDKVSMLLEKVGLTPANSFLFRFPHELSGGQRQRVAIARALVLDPAFVAADEPTSMLDVSIRTGIMRLMADLQEEYRMSYLYITHDLAVARYLCDRIAVMYLGKIVEMGDTETVIRTPQHPYTRALISAVPVPNPKVKRQPVEIKGGVSQPINPPARCRFFERCAMATERCEGQDHPALVEKAPGHWVSCYEV
jgi:peptide/nickel transport system ATP-binding protein